MDLQTAINLFIFVLPAYAANALPVLLGGGAPLDLERNFTDKRRIFGNGKTIMGFLGGVFSGICAGGIITYFTVIPFFPDARTQFIAFSLMSLGTMAGDALGSFVKRRLGMGEGKQFILDQLMFLIVALIAAFPFASRSAYSLELLVVLFVATYILHAASNLFANKMGWKKVPW